MRWTRSRSSSAPRDRPIKVTLFTLNYWPETTGIGPYAHDLAVGLQERGFAVQVVTAYPHYPQWKVWDGYGGSSIRSVHDGVQVTRLRHYVPKRPTSLRRAISELTFGLRLAFTSWHSPDVALFMSPAMLGSAVALTARGVRRRRAAAGVIVQDLYTSGVRELGTAGQRASGLVARAEGSLLRKADGVATIHDRLADQVAGMGATSSKIRVIRNWSKSLPSAPPMDRVQQRVEFGWEPDAVVVLHAGAMGVKQGLENVLGAARLSQRSAPKVRFVLLGDGSRRRDLEEAARGLRAVEFLDPLPEEQFQVALRCADVLLINELPDLEQTAVPSKLSSYLAAGVPVLAAVRPGSVTEGEVIASGGGICVPAGDPAELVRAAMQLSAAPMMRTELGERGLEYCSRVLSKDSGLNAYSNWVGELARSRQKGDT